MGAGEAKEMFMRRDDSRGAALRTDAPALSQRSIHLDFHTSPLITPIASEFDAVEFAERFERLSIDSVTLFAKCHHGQLYYDTERAERHPGLGAVNLLRAQVEALRSKGIRSPIYLSVLFDEHAAAEHPEWVARDANDAPIRVDSHGVPGWHVLDMTSPYQDYLAEQVTDVLEHFPDADGFFYDICFDQPSFSSSFRAAAASMGLNPDSEPDRVHAARGVSHDYMARFRDMVSHGRGHDQTPRTVFFNSRPRLHLADEKQFCTHDEVEALPTGGWGYSYAPYVARNVLPVQPRAIGMTGRFFGSWGDSASLHPESALVYESLQMVSLGMGICIGDSLPASGRSHEAVTARLEVPLGYIERVQSVASGYQRDVEVAVLRPVPDGQDVHLVDAPGVGELGALRFLTERGAGFDFVTASGDWSHYSALLVLAGVTLDESLRGALSRFVGAGGSVFFSGLPDAPQDWTAELLGVTPSKDVACEREFFRAVPALTGLADFDFVTPGAIARAEPTPNTEVLATVTEPFFDRTPTRFSGHEYTPAGVPTSWPAVVVSGRVATALFPLVEAYGSHGVPEYAQLASAAFDRVFPRSAVRVEGPSHLEVAVHRANTSTLVHVLSFVPARRSQSEIETVREPVPVIDLALAIRTERAPRSVRRALDDVPIDFSYRDGYVQMTLSFASGHEMLVFDCDDSDGNSDRSADAAGTPTGGA